MKYLTTKDVCQRYNITRGTIYKWMNREEYPFPQPRLRGTAGQNRWAEADLDHFDDSLRPTIDERVSHHA